MATKPRVLIVEDDEDSLLVLEAALTSWGFAVQTARSCAAAKTALTMSEVDALVTDLSLNDGTGIELLRGLSRRPRLALLLTGHGGDEERAASARAGFDAHLVKPVDLSELVSRLRKSLAA